jgi:anti-anti-sigma regulatory factor
MTLTNHKIFVVEQIDQTIVVTPQGDASGFRYNDVHSETNALLDYIQRGRAIHVIVDFSQVEIIGSIMISSLMKIARKVGDRGGQACFCQATGPMREVMQSKLAKQQLPR